MVTITSNIFINIFQTVHFSAIKFTRGNEKNMSCLLIPKSLKVWEKSEAIGPGTFKFNCYISVSHFSYNLEIAWCVGWANFSNEIQFCDICRFFESETMEEMR